MKDHKKKEPIKCAIYMLEICVNTHELAKCTY